MGRSADDDLSEQVREVEVVVIQDNHRREAVSGEANTPFWRNSRPLVNKTKSRLFDPPEEELQRSKLLGHSANMSVKGEEGPHKDGVDIDDIPEEFKRSKLSIWTLIQGLSLVVIIAAIVCSVTIHVLKRQKLWDLPLWKWELLVFALICGNLVSSWVIRLVVFLVERNFILRKRVLYFVYGLKKAVENCLWFGFVLLVWNFIFDAKVEKETKSKILPYVTKILVCILVGTVIWLVKTLLVKVLAMSFHVNTFFDRIQESLFDQYVIETLSGPPLFDRNCDEEERALAEILELQNSGANVPSDLKETLFPRMGRERGNSGRSPVNGKSPRVPRNISDVEDVNIPIEQLNKLNQRNVSAWNMKRLINVILKGSLSTLDEHINKSNVKDEALLEIRSEREAEKAAKKIFRKVAKPGAKYIYLEDLMRFMSKEEAYQTIHLFGSDAEHEGISRQSLKDWVVHAFRERRALALSLNDTKTAVDKLHHMLNVIVGFIIVIISLMILQADITHLLLVISSQLVVMAFIFGNTCKTVFEAIIFLFIVHPFDVGDRCEIDGVQMVVEEINILTTVFLRYDNQKIVFPNSVLATKAIGNNYRSPDMGDAVDFSIHISTPLEKIAIMKERIIRYIESKSDHWQRDPMVIMREFQNLSSVLMSVWLTHKMNHQDMGERYARRALLVEEMVKIFKELDVEYRLLPLNVNIRSIPESHSAMV